MAKASDGPLLIPSANPSQSIGILVGRANRMGSLPPYLFTPSRDSVGTCLVYRAGVSVHNPNGKYKWEEWGWLTPETWKAAIKTSQGLQKRDCSSARIFVGHQSFSGYCDNLFDVVNDPNGDFELTLPQTDELLKRRVEQFERLSKAWKAGEEAKGSGSIHKGRQMIRSEDVFQLFTQKGIQEDRVSLELACEAMRLRSDSTEDTEQYKQWMVSEGVLFQQRLSKLYHGDYKRLLRAMTSADIILLGAGGGLSCQENPVLHEVLTESSRDPKASKESSDVVKWLYQMHKANTSAKMAADNHSFFFTVPFERALSYVKTRSCWLFRGSAICVARDARAELLEAFRSNLALKSERRPAVWRDAQSTKRDYRKQITRLGGLFKRFRRAFSPRIQDGGLSVAGPTANPDFLVENSADCIKQMWAKAVSYRGLGNDGRWRLFQTLSRAVSPSARLGLTDAITHRMRPGYMARYTAERRPSQWSGIAFEIKKGVQRTTSATKGDGKQTTGPLPISCIRMIADGLCPFAANGPVETATQRCADAAGMPKRVSEPLDVTAFKLNTAKEEEGEKAKASNNKRRRIEISAGT